MISSTLGFIFTPDFKKVLLIEKEKPEFHKGKLNGLGGKCEPGESRLDCLVREVQEKADIHIPSYNWCHIGEMNWKQWHVTLYAAIYTGQLNDIQNSSEKVSWYSVNDLPSNIITNLSWLIPLSIDCLQSKAPPEITIQYPT